MSKNHLIDELYDAGVFKFGKFTLKSNLSSPIYVDLRVIISHPSLLRKISDEIWNHIVDKNIKVDCVCGVPYAALPVASVLSVDHDMPMLIRRKEAKNYGTQKIIEGNLIENSKCLIIEDVVTTGSSVVETAKLLRQHNLTINDAVVILDRQQGAESLLKSQNINIHSLFNLDTVLEHLYKTEKISKMIYDEVCEFFTKDKINGAAPCTIERSSTRFVDRIKLGKHPKLKQLYEIMQEKKSNLCLAVDLTDAHEILNLVAKIGSEICLLKLHADIVDNFSWNFVADLKKYSENLRFMIIEDRKFADIGNTVRSQFSGGPFKISSWAHFVTVHTIAGPGVFEESIKLAQEYSDIVAGFICQKRLQSDDDSFVYMTPGVHIESSSDNMKQKWRSPEEAISIDGNDIIIVGRGIVEATEVGATATKYKTIGWQCLTA